MKLRLYHHPDGARVAYREAGTGPALALLHSPGLSHREWEPLCEELADRFRLVLPDLPLHGDSEDRRDYPYSADWYADVVAGFLHETCGSRPMVGGHDVSSQLLVRAIGAGRIAPGRLVLMSSPLHRRRVDRRVERGARAMAKLAAVPGLDRAMARGARVVGERLAAEPSRDLVRHAMQGMAGNPMRARGWSRAVRRWPAGEPADLLAAYRAIAAPTLLLWAGGDPLHPVAIAEEALEQIPGSQLRILPGTGYLMAYDDPVGLARELAAFCG